MQNKTWIYESWFDCSTDYHQVTIHPTYAVGGLLSRHIDSHYNKVRPFKEKRFICKWTSFILARHLKRQNPCVAQLKVTQF